MADPKKGTGKKPPGTGRRLYTDENPRDTVKIKFATPADASATVAKVKRINKPFARKIQKTLPGQGYHIWHCEADSLISSRRMLFVFMYLNTCDEGGETEFLYQHKRIKPKAGTIVISPAAWTHTHRGNPPLSGEKYMINGWLEFKE